MSGEYLTQEDFDKLLDTKLSAAIETIMSNTARQIEASGGGLDKFLDTLIAESDDLEDDEGEDDYEDDEDEEDDYEDEEPVKDPEVAQLKRKLDALEKQAQDDRTAREEAQYQQKRDALRNATIEAITKTGKVVNASQLLRLLETEGKIVEKDGRYAIEGKDQYGSTFTPVEDSIDDLLSTDYGHFAPSRPGTGTGATAAGSTRSVAGGYKYFDNDGKPKGNVGELMSKDPTGYMAELSQVQGR